MSREQIDIIFLLDRSGSMYGCENDTIGGFNSFIENQIKQEVDAKVTTVLFDHGYEVLYRRKDIHKIGKLTHEEYYVRGSTALFDAIGKTIVSMDREVSNRVLFVITTDGLENSSVEFSKDQIKNMIRNHNWEFIFLGADIDAYSEASKIGIRMDNTAIYKKSSRGMNDMFKSVEKACMNVSMEKKLDASWKADLE
ncbi:MAG: VWA domain-containing protein [Methanobrevibacter sp.]|uniref:vWA domain-containing protein n=1 Tax=Methanobrevibacter sp. TaxID=66852 RepID=UPI001B1985FD|nr:vWA domain-containing protein [Methanobrevibacter sp.]MBO5151119.1 VWA domain-containing protein [Methanobrevibacter sp.]